MPAAKLARRLAEGSLSSETLVRATLERIQALDTQTRAFVTVDADGALAAAREADAARRSGRSLGPLHGLPVSVKDVIATQGVRTTDGSRLFANHVPRQEPVAVARVRRAGGIIIGKTATPEFAHKVLTDSPLFGVTRNPWSLAHSAGGSSGGAGVSAAMGFTALNMTTDGAGSSRVPASCCGTVGLKPTLGAVPNEASPDMFGLQVLGAIGRTVDDVALLFDVMRGPHAADPLTLAAPGAASGDRERGLDGLRIAWLPRIGNERVDQDVLATTEQRLRQLQAHGARVREAEPIQWSLWAWRTLLRAQQAQRFADLAPEDVALLDTSMQRCLDEGRRQDVRELQAALLERTALYRRVQRLFDDADLLASPVVATPALSADHDADEPVVIDGGEAGSLRDAWYCYTIPFNASGHPAIVLPCGSSRTGLPVGMQFVAPWHREDLLIGVARTIERCFPWKEQWPALARGPLDPPSHPPRQPVWSRK